MSKRMIDSEVSDKIRYKWDAENEESHLDIENVDSVDIRSNVGVNGLYSEGGLSGNVLQARARINTPEINISGDTSEAIRVMIAHKSTPMTGRQIANKQLFYHCIKLTSATKTVYVNINSQAAAECTSKLAFQLLIKGDQGTAPEFYYGAGNSVVHFFKDSTGMHCMIDDEEVTTYEDHTYPVFIGNHVVVG